MKMVALVAIAIISGSSAIANAQQFQGDLAQPVESEITNINYTETILDDAALSGCDSTPLCGGCDTGCNSCCSSGCGWFSWPCKGHCEPWTLFPENRCGITIGGWVQGGYYGNSAGTNVGNHALAWNDGDAGEPVLNQAWIYAENVADAETYYFDIGYRADFAFGSDADLSQSFRSQGDYSFDKGWNSGGGYGSSIPQLYLSAAWGNWNLKAGHFLSLMGYESVMAPKNFFYSHSNAFNFATPYTHTGALAEYTGCNNITLIGGWVNGWDQGFDNSNGSSIFLGGVKLALTDNTNLSWIVNGGNTRRYGPNASSNGDLYSHSLVLDHNFGCGYNYVFNHDYGHHEDAGGAITEWYTFTQYLYKEINECWSVGVRAEWYVQLQDPNYLNGDGEGNYYSVSLGANWKPSSNLTVRPEMRFDKFDDRGNNGKTPWVNHTKDNIMFYGLDAILTF